MAMDQGLGTLSDAAGIVFVHFAVDVPANGGFIVLNSTAGSKIKEAIGPSSLAYSSNEGYRFSLYDDFIEYRVAPTRFTIVTLGFSKWLETRKSQLDLCKIYLDAYGCVETTRLGIATTAFLQLGMSKCEMTRLFGGSILSENLWDKFSSHQDSLAMIEGKLDSYGIRVELTPMSEAEAVASGTNLLKSFRTADPDIDRRLITSSERFNREFFHSALDIYLTGPIKSTDLERHVDKMIEHSQSVVSRITRGLRGKE